MIIKSSPWSIQRIWGTLCQFNSLWINSFMLPSSSLHWFSCHLTTLWHHHLAHPLTQWASDQLPGGPKAHPEKLMLFRFSPRGTPCRFEDLGSKYLKVPFQSLHSLSLSQRQSPINSTLYNVGLFPRTSTPSFSLEIALLMWFSSWYCLNALLFYICAFVSFICTCWPHSIIFYLCWVLCLNPPTYILRMDSQVHISNDLSPLVFSLVLIS